MRNAGKDFESRWRACVPDNVYYHRVKDPAQAFTQTDALRFSAQNPFDCLLFDSPLLFALELKSVGTNSLSYWRSDFDITGKTKTYNIKRSQVRGLEQASKFRNIVAGFILNFRSAAHTYFLDINKFLNYTNSLDKKSINEDDVIAAGGVLVSQTLLRTRYSYDVGGLLDGFKEPRS